MKFGLPELTIEKLNSVFAKFPEVREVIISGSRAKGNFREGSDIDLTLKGENLTEAIRKQIWLELDDLNTPYLIDLSVFHHLDSEALLNHIEKAGKVFYRKKSSDVPI